MLVAPYQLCFYPKYIHVCIIYVWLWMPNLPRAVSVFVSFGFCWVSFASGECFPPQNYTIDLVFSHSSLPLVVSEVPSLDFLATINVWYESNASTFPSSQKTRSLNQVPCMGFWLPPLWDKKEFHPSRTPLGSNFLDIEHLFKQRYLWTRTSFDYVLLGKVR